METLNRNQFGRLTLEDKVRYTREVRHPDGTDYVECAICGLRGRDLVSHVTRTHKMKGQAYKDTYGVPLVSPKLSEFKSKKTLGENNPAYQHGGRLSPWSKKSDFYSEESKQKAHQNRTPITHLQWWLDRGFTAKDYYEHQSVINKNRTVEQKLVTRRKKQLTHYESGRGIHPDQKNEYEIYHSLCWFYTNQNDLTLLEGHEKRGRIDENPEAYHLDHITSISYGFNNDISPEEIGSLENLRFILGVENVRKGAKCG